MGIAIIRNLQHVTGPVDRVDRARAAGRYRRTEPWRASFWQRSKRSSCSRTAAGIDREIAVTRHGAQSSRINVVQGTVEHVGVPTGFRLQGRDVGGSRSWDVKHGKLELRGC